MGRVKDSTIEDENINGEIIQSIHLMLDNLVNLVESENFKYDLDKDFIKLRNNTVLNIINFSNYLDQNLTTFDLKSTIKLSYGTKKILDNLNKSNFSYEDLILNLINENNKLKSENDFLLSKISKTDLINFDTNSYQRISKIFDFLDMKIRYSINKFSVIDDSYKYNLKIEKVTRDGKEISLDNFYQLIYILFNQSNSINLKEASIIGESIIYFIILYNNLKQDFKIKGKITNNMISRLDYWEYILTKLNLTENIKNEDINQKIESFKLQLKQLKI